MMSLWENFCKNSSLHGVQYLVGKNKKSYLGKLIWVLLLAVITAVLVVKTYYMWVTVHLGPVQVLVDNPAFSLKNVEFPEVIVCPKTKVLKSKFTKVAKNYSLDTQTSLAFQHSLLALSLIGFPYFNLPQDYLEWNNKSTYNILNQDVEELMRGVSADVDDIMVDCSWKEDKIPCKELFKKQVTGEGFCFAFNSKKGLIWKDGQKQVVFYEPYTKRIETQSELFGSASGLSFSLKSLADEQITSELEGNSYNVLVTNPYTTPDLSYASTVLPTTPLNQVLISVSVEVIEAHTSLNNLEESERGCYFSKFENMSQIKQCDCQMTMIFKMCNCLPFYLYHPESKTVCGLEHLQCLRQINPFLRNYGIPKSAPGFPSWTQPITYNCLCSQPCSHTIYTPEMRVVRLARRNPSNGTKVQVFYEGFAVKYSRTAPYEIRDFVVWLGSTAGLFIGFNSVAVFDFVILLCKFLMRCFSRIFIKENQKEPCVENKMNNLKINNRALLFQRRCILTNSKTTLNFDPRFVMDKPNKSYKSKIFLIHGPGEPYYPFVN